MDKVLEEVTIHCRMELSLEYIDEDRELPDVVARTYEVNLEDGSKKLIDIDNWKYELK